MRIRSPEQRAPRGGFTLVEMLVAISIFAILAVLAIGAYRGLSDTDRLRNGTTQFMGAISKSRSSAIHDKLPRGVRLIATTDDPSLVDSVIQIGTLPNLKGVTLAATEDLPVDNMGYNGRRLVIPSASSELAEFIRLNSLGALTSTAVSTNGLRIKLGADGAQKWYRIQSVNPGDPDGFAIFLAEPYPRISRTGPTLNLTYEIEFGPVPLPGAKPSPLPQDIVIDLDASQIPARWRTGNATSPYFTQMDIMLTPTGKLQGAMASEGMLHFFFADRRDATEDPATPLSPASYPYFGTIVDAYESRLVTLVTATAQTYGAEVDTTATGPGNTNRYRYAVYGKEDSN
ncbi:MAG: prepilin-type N-terminal cleavage/methylation domain-containing protein [Planctomycetaceae bacterium]